MEKIKPEDRCLKWNQQKLENIENARKENNEIQKQIEDNFIHHKLQINKYKPADKLKSK